MKNFTIVGIASKLLTHFERIYKPTKITSYADLRWSNGNVYNQLGFKMDHQTNPNYWYTFGGVLRRIHRFNFRKDRLAKLFEEFDSNLTEWQMMQNRGYDRIWDCGNLAFIKEFKSDV
jgi:hypothetical protein